MDLVIRDGERPEPRPIAPDRAVWSYDRGSHRAGRVLLLGCHGGAVQRVPARRRSSPSTEGRQRRGSSLGMAPGRTEDRRRLASCWQRVLIRSLCARFLPVSWVGCVSVVRASPQSSPRSKDQMSPRGGFLGQHRLDLAASSMATSLRAAYPRGAPRAHAEDHPTTAWLRVRVRMRVRVRVRVRVGVRVRVSIRPNRRPAGAAPTRRRRWRSWSRAC